MSFGPATTEKIAEVVDACERRGRDSIILLSGVTGTGKTFVALAAAQEYAGHPLFVREIQFHQGYTYEDFIEGLKPTRRWFEPRAGIFSEWNEAALRDLGNKYVLLIEEFSRANISAVLGELMTYIEYRDRMFEMPVARRRIRVAPNLTLIATMNPRDRSALEIDDALLRRVFIVNCPPSTAQLVEMLQSSLPTDTPGRAEIIERLVRLFDECQRRHPETYEELMPFGHGMFAGIRSADDLQRLWRGRIRHLLRRPQIAEHPFAQDIEELYPWR